MAVNNFALNSTQPLNGFTNQLVDEATNILQIEQVVQYAAVDEAESLVDIEQTVYAFDNAENVVTFAQRVIDAADVLSGCANWNANIYIAGALIPRDEIIGRIEVSRAENNAAQFSFTRKMPLGAIDPDADQGKAVILDIEQGSDFKRTYTGIVDIPVVDIVNGWITYKCTDRRRELINAQLITEKDTIGTWSETIFGEPEDVFDEVQDRLTTTMQAVDFDQYGLYTLSDLNPKASPDYTLTDSDVYREDGRDPTLELTSRARIINKVNINFDYRYPKLYHWEVSYSWVHPYQNTICNHFQSGALIPTRSMIASAAAGGWPVKGNITFGEVWANGFYNCGGATVAFSTISVGGDVQPLTDENGDTVTDTNGNTIYTGLNQVVTDTRGLLALSANWAATNRWAQTITEEYSLTVQAPQSQTKFGDVIRNRSYGLESPFDTAEWEDYESYDTQAGTSGSVTIDKDVNRTETNRAITTALNIAKTDILKSHRDNRVTFVTDIWPEIDLKHTVRLNCTNIDVTGKVSGIRHSLDVSTRKAETTVELSFSQSEGSTSDSTLTVPSAPTYTATQVATTVALQTYIGTDPANDSNSSNWSGFITPGFDLTYGLAGQQYNQRDVFAPRFVVFSPEVQSDARESKSVTASSSYNVEIPNDTLTITKTGGC